jgi:hypothetical protein
MCVNACSSSYANAFTPPFLLLDYAMKKDEAHATVKRRKVVTVAVLKSKQETRETKRYSFWVYNI